MNRTKNVSLKITMIAMAAAINLIGAQVALVLRLPIYLDSIGTIFVAIAFGPWYGVLPGIISSLISGFTTDIYAIYFMPSQMITAIMAGGVLHQSYKKLKLPFLTLLVTVPGTILSSVICAVLFDGVTSSGSAMLVFLLRKLGLGMAQSVFVIQVITDYFDKLLAILISLAVIKAVPLDWLEPKKGKV